MQRNMNQTQGFYGTSDRYSSNRRHSGSNRYSSNKKAPVGGRIKLGLFSFLSTIKELIRSDDGFYDEERAYSRDVMSSRQYYPSNMYDPPTSRYAGRRSREEYDEYARRNPVFREATDVLEEGEEIVDTDTRKSGLGRKLQLKTKAAASKVADKVVKTTASSVSKVTEEVTATVATFAANKVSVEKKVSKEEVKQNIAEKKLAKMTKRFGDDLDFDLELHDVQNTFTDIDLLKDEMTPGIWYKSTLTSPIRLMLNDLTARHDTLTSEYLAKKKPLPIAKELEAIQDVILLIPTKTKYVVVPDTKKGAMFRQIEIKLAYSDNEEESYRNYTCDELYIHAKSKMPLTIFFRVSEEQL